MTSKSINIKDWRADIPGKLVDAKTYQFPPIVSINAHGKESQWIIQVRLQRDGEFIKIADRYFDNDDMDQSITGWIKVLSGVTGGKVRDSSATTVTAGKNKGRANATNVFCQSIRDAFGLYNKQLKKAAPMTAPQAETKTTIDTNCARPPPMLAKIYDPAKADKQLPRDTAIFVQRKYNGVRMVATLDPPRVLLYGRSGNEFPDSPGFAGIRDALLLPLQSFWDEERRLHLDGEVYKHGMALQDISGHARRSDSTEPLDYVIYDCFIVGEDLKFSQRRDILAEIFDNFEMPERIKLAQTWRINDRERTREEIQSLYEGALRDSFEGVMIRLDQPYRHSYNQYHCSALLKMKPAFDEEYEVIGWTVGDKGKAAEALMIICQTPGGKKFSVTPAMTLNERIDLAKKMRDEAGFFEREYLGKFINVTFDEMSKDGVPLRARTSLMRLDIDIVK